VKVTRDSSDWRSKITGSACDDQKRFACLQSTTNDGILQETRVECDRPTSLQYAEMTLFPVMS
jgi:hypothetical protein